MGGSEEVKGKRGGRGGAVRRERGRVVRRGRGGGQ